LGYPGKKTQTAMKRIIFYPLLAWLCATAPAWSADTRQAVDPELRELLRTAANESESFEDRFDAEVWLTDMSKRLEKRVPNHAYRINLLRDIHAEATHAGLEPELVLSVIQVESNFNPFAISNAGARGLMQVMPFWLKEIGRPGDSLFREKTNLRYGCTILKYYLDKERGNRVLALARYNGSVGSRKYPARVYKLLNTTWFRQ
jgi:soluble lytic murein transglycosylase-like protein